MQRREEQVRVRLGKGREEKSRGAATEFSGSLPFWIRTGWLML